MFRHDDHKFEWTIVEFRSWIETIAEVYGYQVKFDEIGRGYRLVDDVKVEDLTDGENARCASHCCILTRILPKEQIATSNAVEENEKSYKTMHDFMASDRQICEDGEVDIFESTFDHLAFETKQGLMANMYQVWLDEEIRKAYCGSLETFLPDAKSLQNKEYSLVEKDGDIYILKKLL
ncbi:hypothetical protein L7F22_019600 [Adiantum nelumboides]|nr:hypothetical protein [Adiantum nelumboides]